MILLGSFTFFCVPPWTLHGCTSIFISRSPAPPRKLQFQKQKKQNLKSHFPNPKSKPRHPTLKIESPTPNIEFQKRLKNKLTQPNNFRDRIPQNPTGFNNSKPKIEKPTTRLEKNKIRI